MNTVIGARSPERRISFTFIPSPGEADGMTRPSAISSSSGLTPRTGAAISQILSLSSRAACAISSDWR